jgi:Uma2 family endonuclease
MTTTSITNMNDTELLEPKSRAGTPTWEMARFYPVQGDWSEEEYLALHTRQLIEFTDGYLEFLPMPTRLHRTLAQWLFLKLHPFVSERRLGEVHLAPLRVKMRPKKYREPDLVFLSKARVAQLKDMTEPPLGADLAVEVMSEGEENRVRDLQVKRHDYAEAGIPEYWIVDPEARTVTVLVLDGEEYFPRGVFGEGETAESGLLDGFAVDVTEWFRSIEPSDETVS